MKQNDTIETATTLPNQNQMTVNCNSSMIENDLPINNDTTNENDENDTSRIIESSKKQKMIHGGDNNKDDEYHYVSKKPKWWKRVAGRRGSKQQCWALKKFTNHDNYWTSSSTTNFTTTTTTTTTYKERCLEIGCGQGHVLLENAKNYPHRLYIGADIHKPALGALLLRMYHPHSTNKNEPTIHDHDDQDNDKNVNESTTNNSQQYDDHCYKNQYANVILYGGDGMQWLRPKPKQQHEDTTVPPNDWFQNIYITFPDPFPKHSKYRIIQKESLQWMYRVLDKNVGCVFIATDDEQFANWSQSIFESSSSSWSPVLPCPPRSSWLPIISTYEQKGIDEGRKTHLQCWKCI